MLFSSTTASFVRLEAEGGWRETEGRGWKKKEGEKGGDGVEGGGGGKEGIDRCIAKHTC